MTTTAIHAAARKKWPDANIISLVFHISWQRDESGQSPFPGAESWNIDGGEWILRIYGPPKRLPIVEIKETSLEALEFVVINH